MTTRTIAIKVDPTQAQAGARVVKRDLNEMADLAKKAEQSTGRLGSAANDNFVKAARGAGVATRALNLMKVAALGVAAALSVGALKAYADQWSDLQSKVGAAVKDMDAAPALMQRMTDIANASYSPLSQTVDAYSRNVGVLRDLGISAQGAADFTEALNHSLVITATRGEQAASVQNALAKAMATGKLSGEGLESVLTNGGRVAEALAQQLGVAQGQLRGLASEGRITADVIAKALIGNLEALRDEAGNMSATLADAGVIWNNVFTEWVGRIDQAWGVTSTLAEKAIELAMAFRETADVVIRVGNIIGSLLGPAFEVLGSNIEMIGQVATVAGAALLGYFAGPTLIAGIGAATTAIVTGLVPALGAVVGGIKAIGLAMMANPLGLLIGGLALAVTAAFTFRDEIKQSIGVDVVEVFRTGANWIIGAMVGAVKAVSAAWGIFPQFMAALGKEAWNSFLSGFEGAAVKWTNPLTGEVFDLIKLDLTNFKHDVEVSSKDIAATLGGAVTGAFKDSQVDYLGGMFDGVSDALGKMWGSAEGAAGGIAGLAGELGAGIGTGGAGSGLAGAAGEANTALNDLISTADKLAESMFPGEYARREAEALAAAFARYGDALDDFQRQAVQDEIADLFKASEMGVRRLEDQTKESARNMATELQKTVGASLEDCFDGAIEDISAFGEVQ
ncbi:tape measure protein [Devosia sp. SD17-2]|uniref:tape measure protein n=1 Tax=Devosia sp. SD17-2 TaxID=2976459 RepID=UPI0023D7E920|nr:tape measure protein [Devosia sp. SD17-2]WEJ31992.1 tape measure protein [Devosia sp. SD17-2]